MIGTKLGPYEILEKIGAGGMGEVYRARDERLGREVAVKVLPSRYSSDPDRLRRFEQEARAAGVLNHPNILAIHDIGTHEGAPYVVSELLEGETLRERMGGSPLPLRKAVDYAEQTAQGLAAAHQKGIVHRDLKPDNLFITEDGRVKILDFGLAKLTRPEASGEEETNLPTVAPETEPGKVMGTSGYMSPEQVKGVATDHRSDIFTLGAILYEMVTGQRAFRRDTAVETMNAILKEDPPALSETQPGVDPSVDRVIRHCLEKSPAERFQSARDLAFDLASLSAISGTGTSPAIGSSRTASRGWWLALAGVVVLAAVAATGFYLGKSTQVEVSTTGPPYQRLTFRRGVLRAARFAPDGHTIVYSAAWEGNLPEIFTTRPESPESRSLGIPNCDLLSVSRNGELAILLNRVATVGWTSHGTLARLPLEGGTPRQIAAGIQDADWSPDGSRLTVVRWGAESYTLEYPLGTELYRTSGWISQPRISPDGERVAFFDHPVRGDNRGRVAVVDAGGGEVRRLTPNFSLAGLAWSIQGDRIWFSGAETGLARDLYTVTLAGDLNLKARVPGDYGLHDLHPSGGLLMSQDALRREMIVVREGERPRDLSWLDWTLPADVSPDGNQILFAEQGAGAGRTYGIYVRGVDGAPPVNLGPGVSLAISPDGKEVLAMKEDFVTPTILPIGVGEPRVLDTGDFTVQFRGRWFPDGKRLLLGGSRPGEGIRLYAYDLEGGSLRPITPEGTGIGYAAPISPDGRYVATITRTQDGVGIYPVDEGEMKLISGIHPGEYPLQWSADGRYLFVASRQPPQVKRLNLETGEGEVWREIEPPDPKGIVDIGPVHITPDGKTIVYGYKRVLSDLYLVRGLQE